jgi:hypothetical protein
MSVSVYSMFVFWVYVAALQRADPHPRSPTDCVKDQETEKAAKDQQGTVEPQTDRWCVLYSYPHWAFIVLTMTVGLASLHNQKMTSQSRSY